jgi:hypothetical protein
MVRHKVTVHETVGITDSVQYRGRTEMAHVYIKEAKRTEGTRGIKAT